MSLPDPRLSRRRTFGLLLRLGAVAALAGGLAGCFQPMYAETTPGGGPGLRESMGDIEVVFVAGRLGNEVRNDLIFELTGGAGNPVGAPYRLFMKVADNTAAAIIDPVSGLPEVELVTVDVAWQLFEADDKPGAPPATVPPKDKKPIQQGTAFGKASVDSGYQRFARQRAIRDAQNRSAKLAAQQIRGQIASYLFSRAPKT